MRIGKFVTRFIALSLAILTAAATSPVSAAEIVAPANIGSVSAVGSVQLRGVGVSEGTLFSGDRVSVAPGGYAKIVLGSGPKVELAEKSDVTVSKDSDAVSVNLTSGNIAFTGGQKPVRVRVGTYEITANSQARGSVAYVGTTAFGIRVIDGSVNVRNVATKQSFTVQKGNERLVSLTDNSAGGVRLASAVPTAIPAAPAMPVAQSGGMKTAILVGSVLGSAAAIAVLMSKNDDSDSEAALRLRRTTASQTAANVTTTANAASLTADAINTAAANAATAINAAPTNTTFLAADKTALVARANTLASQATASKTQILALQLQLAGLQTQLTNAPSAASVGPIETQILTVLANLNSQVNTVNGLINTLAVLVTDARAEVPNVVPIPTIQPVQPATPASPSVA